MSSLSTDSTESSYRELLKQAAQIQAQITEARLREASTVLAEVRELVKEFGFTADDLFGEKPVKTRKKRGKLPQKYRDPVSGLTWSGMGLEPYWIRGRNREEFLVEPG